MRWPHVYCSQKKNLPSSEHFSMACLIGLDRVKSHATLTEKVRISPITIGTPR